MSNINILSDFSLVSSLILLILFGGSIIWVYIRSGALIRYFGWRASFLTLPFETKTKYIDKLSFYFVFGGLLFFPLLIFTSFINSSIFGAYQIPAIFLFVYIISCVIIGILTGFIGHVLIKQKITYSINNSLASVSGFIYDETDDFIYYIKDRNSGNNWSAIKKDKIITIDAIEEKELKEQ